MVARSPNFSIEIAKPPIVPDRFCRFEWLQRCGEKDDSAARFDTISERFILYSRREVIAARAYARAEIFSDICDLASEYGSIVVPPANAVAHLIKAFGVLLLQSRKAHNFGINCCLLDYKRIA